MVIPRRVFLGDQLIELDPWKIARDKARTSAQRIYVKRLQSEKTQRSLNKIRVSSKKEANT